MTRTYIIADDSMEGRDTGRRGGLRSATYIASELKRLGIEPAGDNGTYFQAIPWVSRTPDSTSALAGRRRDASAGRRLLSSFRSSDSRSRSADNRSAAAFSGENVADGLSADASAIRRSRPNDARGKVVVFAAVRAAELCVLAARQSPSLCRREGDRRRDARSRRAGAVPRGARDVLGPDAAGRRAAADGHSR